MRGNRLFRRPEGICCRLAMMWLAALTMTAPPTRSEAQAPPPITSSGLHTQVSAPITVPGGTQYTITGGTRPGAGPNLFHSFGQFGVPTANIANFLNETTLPTCQHPRPGDRGESLEHLRHDSNQRLWERQSVSDEPGRHPLRPHGHAEHRRDGDLHDGGFAETGRRDGLSRRAQCGGRCAAERRAGGSLWVLRAEVGPDHGGSQYAADAGGEGVGAGGRSDQHRGGATGGQGGPH